MKALHRSTGFTLVELMITVAIVGILAAVATSFYTPYVQKSKCNNVITTVQDISVLLTSTKAERGAAPADANYKSAHTIGGMTTTAPDDVQTKFSYDAGTNAFTVEGKRTDFVCPQGPTGIYEYKSTETEGTWK